MKNKRIMVLNQKGGVGKSTLSYIIGEFINNEKRSLIVNIDQTQSAEEINPGEITLDLIDEDLDLLATLDSLSEDIEVIIVDTPSNFKPKQIDYERMVSIIDTIDLFIVPLKKGERSMSDSFVTLDLMFSQDVTSRTKPFDLLFVLNDYKTTERKDIAKEKVNKYVNNVIKNELPLINIDSNLINSINISYFPNTQVISTLEDNNQTLKGLFEKNRVAYRTVINNSTVLANDVKDIMKGI